VVLKQEDNERNRLYEVVIGLCVKNSSKTIGQNVDSIKNLDYPKDKFQLIVVDGCSSDNTMEIIREKLEGTGIESVFTNDGGRGLSLARQLVVDTCNSPYIIWVDGDNVLSSNLLKSQVEYMNTHQEFAFVGVMLIPLGDTIVSRIQGYQMIIPASDWRARSLQGAIFRVSAIRDVGGFDTAIEGAGEDADLFIRLKIAGWAIGLNRETKIYHYMRDTWRGLWKESVWFGYATHYLTAKHRLFFSSLGRRASLDIADCIKLTFVSFKLTKDLGCVLMPFHYGLTRLGFLVGHYYARKNEYEPVSRTGFS